VTEMRPLRLEKPDRSPDGLPLCVIEGEPPHLELVGVLDLP
jgi:hypothetical protein